VWKLTWRTLLARKIRLLMSTLAVVLGIGFLSGVMTFSQGLGSTFDTIIKGSTPDGVVQPTGQQAFSSAGPVNTRQLSPADIDKLNALPEVAKATGQVTGFATTLLDRDDHVVGGQGAPTIPVSYTGSENILGDPIMALQSGHWPAAPDEITLDPSAAERGGYHVGDTVKIVVPDHDPIRTVKLAGIAEFTGGGTAGAILMLFSTEGAQRLYLDGRHEFTNANLTAADGVTQTQLAAAADRVLPKGMEAVTGDKVVKDSQAQVNQFLDVISTFLTVFAVIAILVGGFIIANTFSILVAQRVRELALLRALGASRRQVTRSVLLEALLMGLLGSTLGLVLGLGLARALAGLFSSLGLSVAGDVLTLSGSTIAAGYVVGLLVTMLSAYFPARRAARVEPVAAMRDDLIVQEASLRRRAWIGGAFFAVGTAVAVYGVVGAPGNDALWIGVGSVIWVLTTAALAPVIGQPVLRVFRTVFAAVFGTSGRLAGENALRNPRRTGATASALMIGLAVVSAVGVMAASLSKTFDDLVDDQFTADFLVQSSDFLPFPTALGDRMAQVPGVQTISRQQFSQVRIDGKDELLTAVDGQFGDIYHLAMLHGSQTISGHDLLISQSTAQDDHLAMGDHVKLRFPGEHVADVTVSGIFKDTPVIGGYTVPMDLLAKNGIDRTDFSISINAAEGADLSAVSKGLKDVVGDIPIVQVQDKREFIEATKAQINQLLYIIYGLLALAIVIAVFGIVNTLGLSVIERTREIGLLRAVGMSRRRLRVMIGLESVVIALLGAVLGLGVGLLVGVLLRQSLSKDITALAMPIGQLVTFLVLAVVVGVLASIVPAIRASRMKVLDAIAHVE
jgi:putative ABC transport system permease protein